MKRDFHYRYDMLKNGIMVSNKKSLIYDSFVTQRTYGLVTDFYNFHEKERLALKRIVTDENGHPVKETYYVDATVFYCNVEPLLDSSCFYSFMVPEYFPYKLTGEGTKEKPWNNIYAAVYLLECYYRHNCCDRYAVLKLSGKMNYSLSGIIDFGRLFVLYDLSELEFQISDKIKYWSYDYSQSKYVLIDYDDLDLISSGYIRNLHLNKKIQTDKMFDVYIGCRYLSDSEVTLEINNSYIRENYGSNISISALSCFDSTFNTEIVCNGSGAGSYIDFNHAANVNVNCENEAYTYNCWAEVAGKYYTNSLIIDCSFNLKAHGKNGCDTSCSCDISSVSILKNVSSTVHAVCEPYISGDDIYGSASAVGFSSGLSTFINCTSTASASGGCDYQYSGFVSTLSQNTYYSCTGTVGQHCRYPWCRITNPIYCEPYGDIV